jgi:hypothetical protein
VPLLQVIRMYKAPAGAATGCRDPRLRAQRDGGVILLSAPLRPRHIQDAAMRATAEPPPEPDDPALPFWRRLAWFAALVLPVLLAAVGGVYLLKALLQ